MGRCTERREVVLALLQVQFDLNKSERFIPCHKIHWRVPAPLQTLGSFRFEDEDEDEDEDEALCFHHNEIFKLFRLQLDRDDEVDCNNIVTPSLSRI